VVTTEIQPVIASVEVGVPVEEAFRHFTERMHEWWPVSAHSIGEEKIATLTFEPRVGGRVFEVWSNGNEADWADVLEWDPPHHFRLAWHPNESGLSTDVAVSFTPTDTGTRVELTHRGWEILGADALAARQSYAGGWIMVLDHFRGASAENTAS
jgi:hypothetical protein